jgi:predicted nuclease with TOPRIM domain
MNNNRYTIEEIKARTSEKTFQGMSLKIDDLAAIGRVLSIQDDAYDEQFDQIYKTLKDQQTINKEILSTLKELKGDIKDLKTRVAGLELKIGELSGKVDTTRGEMEKISIKVDCLDKDVQRLKKINSITAIAIRIGIGVAIALGISALLFG